MAKIDFVLDRLPGTVYSKDIESNIYKILSSLAEELDTFLNEMERAKNGRFIDYAYGNDLDKIGAIINTQRYASESDASYRGRLKSKIPSFVGGGTADAIKQVVQIFLNVEPMVIEHYLPGDGHPFFNNGILNGFTLSIVSGLDIRIREGTAYISGSRITLGDAGLTIPNDTTIYIKLDSDGNLFMGIDSEIVSNQILIAEVIAGEDSIIKINDKRAILNPFEDYITNTASITVQIPYNFTESKITVQDVKNILRSTKAAGIALLIDVVGSYEEFIGIGDSTMDFSFMVGFSGMGSSNFIGNPFSDEGVI